MQLEGSVQGFGLEHPKSSLAEFSGALLQGWQLQNEHRLIKTTGSDHRHDVVVITHEAYFKRWWHLASVLLCFYN